MANTALLDLDGIAISALTAATNLEDTDILPLYDNSAGDNAGITWANIKTSLNLGNLATLNTVTASEISANAVTTAKINNKSITPIKMAENILADGTDLNTVIDSGSYRLGASGLNWPNTLANNGQLIVSKNSDTIFQMIAFYHNNEIYTRTGWGINYAPTFTNWKKITPAIVQVVQATSSTHQSTTSTSYVDCTGMSASITPSSTSSKILVEVHFQGWHQNSYGGLVKMLRDATEVGSGVAPSGSNAAMFQIRSLDVKTMQANSISFLDQPASVSALTYKLQMRTTNAGYPTYMNRPSTVNSDNCGVISSITLKEIIG